MQYILTLDIGTGGMLAALSDASGRISAVSSVDLRHVRDPATNSHDLDPAKLFATAKRLLKETARKAGGGGIRALAVTSQRHGCVFLDSQDRPLAAFPNLDGRSARICEKLSHHGGDIFRLTARWPAPQFPATRLLWAKQHDPRLHARTARLMMLNEYVVFRLAGVKASEWTNAAETMLFDVHRREWSPALARLFGATGVELGELIPPGTVAGTLDRKMARDLSLDPLPVVMAASDTQSSVIGTGDLQPGDVAVVNGSTTPLVMPLREFFIDPERRVYTVPFFGDEWALESNCGKTGLTHRALLDNLVALLRRFPRCRGIRRDEVAKLLDDPAADPAGLTMHWGPLVADAAGSSKQPRPTLFADNDERDVFSAAIPAFEENIAFAIHENARQLSAISELPIRRLFMTDREAGNRRVRRALKALNPDTEIRLSKEPETTSRGAAIQAWVALGRFSGMRQAYVSMNEASWSTKIPECADADLAERHRQWLAERTA